MDYQTYTKVKNDIEVYFAQVIKNCFKSYVSNEIELFITADYETHRLINKLLNKDGFEVYGMNINTDVFQLQLNFSEDYTNIEKFPFTRLLIDLSYHGNYNVYFSTESFEDDWQAYIEDEFQKYRTTEKDELENIINEIKKVHLMLLLKK